MSTTSQTRPPSTVTEQKCNYCNGTGQWAKDILSGKPPENVSCPHCHGSGKIGHSVVEDSKADAESEAA